MSVISNFFSCLRNRNFVLRQASETASMSKESAKNAILNTNLTKCSPEEADYLETDERKDISSMNPSEMLCIISRRHEQCLNKAFQDINEDRFTQGLATLESGMPSAQMWMYAAYQNLRAYALFKLGNAADAEVAAKECIEHGGSSPFVLQLTGQSTPQNVAGAKGPLNHFKIF